VLSVATVAVLNSAQAAELTPSIHSDDNVTGAAQAPGRRLAGVPGL